MIELLLFGLALVFGVVASGALSLPMVVFGVRFARAAPERAKLRAIPWALAAACVSGGVLGIGGFVWGAGVGDESAGTIAVALLLISGIGGAVLGGIGTFAVIVWMARSPRARSHSRLRTDGLKS